MTIFKLSLHVLQRYDKITKRPPGCACLHGSRSTLRTNDLCQFLLADTRRLDIRGDKRHLDSWKNDRIQLKDITGALQCYCMIADFTTWFFCQLREMVVCAPGNSGHADLKKYID